MSILLVRHGEAVPGGEHGDAPRFLSSRGRVETRSVGAQLHAASIQPSAFVTSPLVRAVQTAEILAHALGFDGVIASDPGLVPDGDPTPVTRRIVGSTGGLLVVVCHEPIIRGIAAILTHQSSYPHFKTSGAILFGEGSGPRAVLGRFEP